MIIVNGLCMQELEEQEGGPECLSDEFRALLEDAEQLQQKQKEQHNYVERFYGKD